MQNEVGAVLHDRLTRGIELTADEQRLLQEWYAQQDGEESETLARSAHSRELDRLLPQVNEVLALLSTAAERDQNLCSETEDLRTQLAALQSQLTKRSTEKSG